MTPWPSEKMKRERKNDAAIARARNIEPWRLRRERYLVGTGRVRQLVDEEQAATAKRRVAGAC
jgi:hypothetical protein